MRSILFSVAASFLCFACTQITDDAVKPTPYILAENTSLPPYKLPADNPLTVEGVTLGRHLFYDPILSKDSTQSCASCHNQAYSFTDNGNATSVGITGKTGSRNAMPLVNLMWAPSYFWDGRSPSIHHQVLVPIQDTLEMNEALWRLVAKLKRTRTYPTAFKKAFGAEVITAKNIALALEQFLLTLISGNSKFDQYKNGTAKLTAQELRGMYLFNSEPNVGKRGADCFHCHSNNLLSNGQFANNGLDSIFTDLGLGAVTGLSKDEGKFKVPSLRNIALSAPYMHDGRFKTLEDVLNFYSEHVLISNTIDPNMHAMQNGLYLTSEEKADIIAFLKTLTDEDFINKSEFGNPFQH